MDLNKFITTFDYIIRKMTEIFDTILRYLSKGSMTETTTAAAETTTAAEVNAG